MPQQFQLTRHPVGSLREIWAMSWPLMLSLMSNSLMLFVDRLLLSWHSPSSLASGAFASMAYYLFLVIPMAICAISEVFVGRLHGEGRLDQIGKPVWQTVWFALFLTIPIWLIAFSLPHLIFSGSVNAALETRYFKTLMLFSPLMCASVAFSGFFIGIGKVKIVTVCTLFANVFNMAFGYMMIFGITPFEPMGLMGAAIATGCAQVFQAFLLFLCYLSQNNRKIYGTGKWQFNKNYFFEALKIGAPAGVGHVVEIFAHFLFFRIIMLAGEAEMAITAFVQSFYLLFGFVVDAQSKGVGAIIANLLGAKELKLVHKVFKSAISLHTIFALCFFGLIFSALDGFFGFFFKGEGALFLNNPVLKAKATEAMFWMCLFFLFDGYCWIMIGYLTASSDTKFIFYVSSIVNWVAYVIPVYFLVSRGGKGAEAAWMIIALYSFINFIIYYIRFKSGKWLKVYNTTHQT